jgi:hypothetical protein
MSSPEYEIFVKTLTGKVISVRVTADNTIDDLTRKLHDKTGVPPSSQKLLFGGKQLEALGTLKSYGIGKEAQVFMVMQMKKEEKKEEEVKVPSAPTPASSTSTTSTTPSTPSYNNDWTKDMEKALLESFVKSAYSSNVEIIFSFDTTGSMASCLDQVRQKVSETVNKLMKDIPNIRIGIISHGDYCDDSGNHTISKLDFVDKSEVDKIVSFVKTVKATGGGDAPEAYELALRDARGFSWTEGYSKALVVIGDEVPHPPSYTTEKINWWEELEKLSEKGVKIYGVRALSNEYAKAFYEELSARTGAVSIHFNNFNLIVDMFLAICYREASSTHLEEFKQEVKQEGKMTQELAQVFDTLEQPNPEKKSNEKKFKLNDPWYNIENDKGTPSYMKDASGVKWVPYKANGPAPTSTTTTITTTITKESKKGRRKKK